MARCNVTFDLGYVPSAAALASRTLVITEMRRAGVDTAPAAKHNADVGATANSVTIALTRNRIFQAVLTDVKTSGESAVPQILNFNTGELSYPGPKAQDRGSLNIYAMEGLSSSSDSSINSSSSSSSVSSASSASSDSSSLSSQSSSSVSSASSASSVNSSSSSLSSVNSSSSSLNSSSSSSVSSSSSSSVSSSSSSSSSSSVSSSSVSSSSSS